MRNAHPEYDRAMRALRALQLIGAASAAAAALGFAASCSSFGAESDESVADATAGPRDGEAPDSESGRDGASTDGASGDAGADLRLPCPPAWGGTTLATAWEKRTIYEPPIDGGADAGRVWMYPFAIATDSSHVTWLAQLGVPGSADDTEPYNGNADAIVLRAPKQPGAPVVLARGQHRAVALALDGDFVYWVTWDVDDIGRMFRQPRDANCDVSCTPELVTTFSARIVRLVRAAPGIFFAVGGGGQTFRFQLGTWPTLVTSTGNYPSIAATSDHVFASAMTVARVTRASVLDAAAVDDPYLAVPALDASGYVGVGPTATDCASLWMVKSTNGVEELYRHDFASAGSFTKLTAIGGGTPGIAADEKYVYGAQWNAGGVLVVEKISGGSATVYAGNVWTVAVDDEGIYFGEHAPRAPATGTLYMRVKK